MDRFPRRLAPSLIALLLGGAPLAAQEPEPAASAAATDSVFAAGAVEGAVAAQASGTKLWAFSGLTGGAVLGPVGMGIAHALAGSSGSQLPAEVVKRIGKKEADFQRGYQQAFTERIMAKRRASVRAGGYVGTVIFIGAAGYLGYERLR